jgi:hypothetical protein
VSDATKAALDDAIATVNCRLCSWRLTCTDSAQLGATQHAATEHVRLEHPDAYRLEQLLREDLANKE